MADRGLTAEAKAAAEEQFNQPIHLVSVHLDSGTVYMTDAYKNITYGGNEYNAAGSLLGFTDVDETAELVINKVTLSLSGVDQSFISGFLSEDYIDRTVKIYKGFLDSNDDLIVDPILILDGRIDGVGIEEDPENGTSVVQAEVTNIWTDFTRLSGRRTNHENQQLFFPGDMGFEFASEVVKDIRWGKS